MDVIFSHSPPRGHRWQHERLDWDHHVNKLVHEKKFCNYYRMSPSAHRHLVRLLDPYLQRVEWNSRDRSPILVEHIISLGLRVLAGAQIEDMRHIIGVSKAAAYQAIDDFVDAVNTHPNLAINFPKSPEQWREVNDCFKAKSSESADSFYRSRPC